MTVLVPLTAAAYGPYREAAAAAYAEENVDSGRWPAEGALERSQADFDSLLPRGVETPDNHLFEIKAEEHGPAIGYLHFAIEVKAGARSAFVYDLEIAPEFRRRGHATAAFRAMEPLARELGAEAIGLHVFAQNVGAQALYRRLGYRVTGMNMVKPLSEEPARE